VLEARRRAQAADVVIVNTCSFLNSAKEESIQTILEAHEERGLRKRRREQKLIVAGCMAQRFSKELPGAMPEVDAFIGLDQISHAMGEGGVASTTIRNDLAEREPMRR